MKFARDALQQDRAQGARQAERFSGAGNIPAYWHVAYSAGLPFSEMAALIDEYLDQLAYFDGVFAGIWKPTGRVLDVQYQLEGALKGLAWLVGLGATRQQLERFLPFCGEPGQDALFDRAVVQLGFERPVAGRLLIESDYRQLLAVADAPAAERPRLAKLALERWTRALLTSGAPTQPGQVGYLGHWALPVALVVMLWDVDDTGLRGIRTIHRTW